jgi:hypothetical protein
MMVFLNICFFVVAPELGYLVGIELFISVTQGSKTNWTYNFLKILHTDFAHYHMFFTLRFKYLQILRKIYSNYVSFPSLLHGMRIIFPSVREITPMKNVKKTYIVNVHPTSQITLSKRSDNVTFSLLQRKHFTF